MQYIRGKEMFNHSERDFAAAREVSFSEIDTGFDLENALFVTSPRSDSPKFIVGFAIALPLSLLMWAAIIAACYRAF
jgi:hypothetical protein